MPRPRRPPPTMPTLTLQPPWRASASPLGEYSQRREPSGECRLSRGAPAGGDLAGHHAGVAGHRRQNAHLALALAVGPVEGDRDLGDAGAEAGELDQQLRLAGEAALADQRVAVLGVALAQDRRPIDAEEARDRAGVQPGTAADRRRGGLREETGGGGGGGGGAPPG